jgi:Lrp/AsnC family transcriptional regulator, leucine-responsive regulatory protein
MAELDPIDRKILAALQQDGRLTNVELAEKVGLSPSPCLRRVKRLEQDGMIAGYRAVLDRRKIGLGLTVFVGVKLDPHSAETAEAFEHAVVKVPEVVACHLVSGESDFLLQVVTRDLDAYERFLSGTLLKLPRLRDVRSIFAMRTHKADAPLPLPIETPPLALTPTAKPRQTARKRGR